MKKSTILILFLILSSNSVFAQETDFVVLKNDSVVTGDLTINGKMFSQSMFILDDSVFIKQQEIKAYQLDGEYYLRMPFGFGDRFALRIEEGNLDLYSRPFNYVSSMNGMYVESQRMYFIKGDGPLKNLNGANIYEAVADNPVSLDFMKKRQGLTVVQVIGALAGIGLTASAFANLEPDETPNVGAMVGGISVFAGSIWIPYFAKADLLDKAIKSYNYPELFEKYGN